MPRPDRTVARSWVMTSSVKKGSFEIEEYDRPVKIVCIEDMDMWVPRKGTKSRRDGTTVKMDIDICTDFQVYKCKPKCEQTDRDNTLYKDKPVEYSWTDKNEYKRAEVTCSMFGQNIHVAQLGLYLKVEGRRRQAASGDQHRIEEHHPTNGTGRHANHCKSSRNTLRPPPTSAQ